MRLWTAPGQRRSANGPGIHIAPNDGLLLGARSLPRKWQCVATPFILNLLAAHSFYLLQSNFFNFHLSIHLSYLVLLLVTVSLCSALARVLHFHGKPAFQVPSAPGRHIIAATSTAQARYSPNASQIRFGGRCSCACARCRLL